MPFRCGPGLLSFEKRFEQPSSFIELVTCVRIPVRMWEQFYAEGNGHTEILFLLYLGCSSALKICSPYPLKLDSTTRLCLSAGDAIPTIRIRKQAESWYIPSTAPATWSVVFRLHEGERSQVLQSDLFNRATVFCAYLQITPAMNLYVVNITTLNCMKKEPKPACKSRNSEPNPMPPRQLSGSPPTQISSQLGRSIEAL